MSRDTDETIGPTIQEQLAMALEREAGQAPASSPQPAPAPPETPDTPPGDSAD